ncbi:MAG: hypothetical protein K2P81_01795 [Bacteriovoracaceae bacterium]|nr:hypothetical protein [Bacteriovoracaceae bacterium]
MKKLMMILALTFSLSAVAGFNDVECMGVTRAGARMVLEVDRGFGGSMRDARTITYGARGENPVVNNYRIFQIRKFGSQLEFLGDFGFNLSVNLFPDQQPRWGWTYRSRFGMENLDCRFPNAQ